MYNLLIALGASVATTLAFGFALGGGSFSIWYGIVPGLLVLVVGYVWLARRTMSDVQEYVEKAQQQVQSQNVDAAVETLKRAYPLADWQFLVEAQIDGQIGQILYSAKRLDDAKPYLEGAISKNWVARAMLGVFHYKNQNYEQMREVFEEACVANDDKPLVWNLYAYCLWKSRNRSDAIDVLNRALENNEDDKKTRDNLNALKNGNKMKMRGWGNMWYQFHLDRPPQQQMKQQVQFRRR